jgi:hypothetical protein
METKAGLSIQEANKLLNYSWEKRETDNICGAYREARADFMSLISQVEDEQLKNMGAREAAQGDANNTGKVIRHLPAKNFKGSRLPFA